MNWLLFIQLWLLVAIAGVLNRKQMIYQEEHAGYRLSLVIVFAPLGLLVNIGSGIVAGLRNYRQFAVASVQGEKP